jgi:hypothetical protein
MRLSKVKIPPITYGSGHEESEVAVTIILKTQPKTGWRSANGLIRRSETLICATCGAICDEAVTADHDAWHATIALQTLPLLSDFVTDLPKTENDQPPDRLPSAKDHIRLPKLTAGDAEA